jgi:mRNA deadenylase 3'-5' endonuclease subunit Ccr4
LNEKLKNYPPILERNFENLGTDMHNSAKDKNEFRVMQWNTLAKALCYPNKSTLADLNAYDWESCRKWRILQEIVRYDADIVCLEETDHYELIKPYLHSIEYTSIFMPKFSSPCLGMINNIGPDGSSIFYRLSKFQVLFSIFDFVQVKLKKTLKIKR